MHVTYCLEMTKSNHSLETNKTLILLSIFYNKKEKQSSIQGLISVKLVSVTVKECNFRHLNVFNPFLPT